MFAEDGAITGAAAGVRVEHHVAVCREQLERELDPVRKNLPGGKHEEQEGDPEPCRAQRPFAEQEQRQPGNRHQQRKFLEDEDAPQSAGDQEEKAG